MGLAACKARFRQTHLAVAPGHEAGAPFHTGIEAVPAPVGLTAHIAHLTFGYVHHGLIAGAGAAHKYHAGQVLGVARIRGAAAEDQRLVAQRLPVHLVHFQLFRGQQLRSHGRYGLAGELHIQNVILIRDFLGGRLAGHGVRGSFGAVSYLHFLGERQLILCVEYTLQLCLGALPGVALQDSGQVGCQFMGVMPDHKGA